MNTTTEAQARCSATGGTYHCAREEGHDGEHAALARIDGDAVIILRWGRGGERWTRKKIRLADEAPKRSTAAMSTEQSVRLQRLGSRTAGTSD